jgi:hypothetical protein
LRLKDFGSLPWGDLKIVLETISMKYSTPLEDEADFMGQFLGMNILRSAFMNYENRRGRTKLWLFIRKLGGSSKDSKLLPWEKNERKVSRNPQTIFLLIESNLMRMSVDYSRVDHEKLHLLSFLE